MTIFSSMLLKCWHGAFGHAPVSFFGDFPACFVSKRGSVTDPIPIIVIVSHVSKWEIA